MSNLVLPKNYQNPTLEKNLEIFFKRYPHERARLEDVLRKPAPNFTLSPVELPEAPSKPPIRIMLLLGITNPVFLATVLNDQTILEETFKVFIFENDPEFAAFCFQNADLSQVIAYDKTEWFICHTPESVKPALFRALRPEAVTSMMYNAQSLQAHIARSKELQDFYDGIPAAYDETCRYVMHNHGSLQDSVFGVEVTVKNKNYVLNNPGISDLQDAYKGETAIIVGAGHSTEENLEKIKQYNDKLVVIAADAALKPLLSAGIRVDYVVSIERANAYQKPFFSDLPKGDAELVAFPVVHPEVLALFPGTVRMVYRNYSFYAYFEKAWPKGILKCGGSASHLGLRLAAYMGVKKILLVGLDSCYQEKDGLYRSHCAGTGHPDWGVYRDLSEFSSKFNHAPVVHGKNNLGQPVVSNVTYYQWSKELSEELADIGQRIPIINCSAGGLVIDGVPYKSLDEAASNLPERVTPKPVPPKPIMTRGWDNKELRKNFEGWLKASKEAVKECEELLKMDEVDQNRYGALFYLYNFRFCLDDMFIAFIVQCAARRFFELENVWWSYNIRAEEDLKQKVDVFKAKFELFQETLERFIEIFKEEGTN